MAFAMPQSQLQHQYGMPQNQNVLPTYNPYTQARDQQSYAPNPQSSNYPSRTSPPLPQQTASPIMGLPPITTVSPTSQMQFHKKGPVAKNLYTPAVLRPTENPRPKKQTIARGRNSPSPLTPPGSLQSSMDSLDKDQKQSLLTRRNTGDSGLTGGSLDGVTSNEEDILHQDPLESYEKVTGFPTRSHWKADSTSTSCNDPSCERPFTYFNRKHHCRRCGSIFCDTHSSNIIPLNQDAEFHPYGNRVRGCDSCWRDYSGWEIKRLEVQSLRRGDTVDMPPSPSSISSPVSVTGFGGDNLFRKVQGRLLSPQDGSPSQKHQQSQVASSVPGDWSWSTF